MTLQPLTRRGFLRIAGAAATIAVMPGGAPAAQPGRAFRLAHLSDTHIRPELAAAKGLAKCLQAVHALDPRPDVIVFGGDMVHNARAADLDRAKKLFDLYTSVIADVDIPIRHCVGNHDVLGWHPRSPVGPEHAKYGKAMVQERLGIDDTSFAFDLGAWRVLVVDDVQPAEGKEGRGYEGGVDEKTLAWLDGQLAAARDRPTLVVTHIPIVSVVAYTYVRQPLPNVHAVPTSLVVRNASQALALLDKHAVKAVLTGHLHQRETITYQKTRHIGQGAVCGRWWGGPNAGTREGFGVVDLHPDGTFDERYVTYPWKAGGA